VVVRSFTVAVQSWLLNAKITFKAS
jgi:hypothetical protein